MKKAIAAEKLIPVLEDKFDLHFESVTKGATVQRKQNETGLVISEGEEGTIIAKISTIDVDRSGEVVIPEGMDAKDFMNNPIICWAHNYAELPIAKVTKLQVTPKAVYAKIVFSATAKAQEIYTLIKEGVLNCNSIGFIATKVLEKGTKAFNDFVQANSERLSPKGVDRIITDWIIMESSIVSLPCNPAAVIQMRKLGISEDMIKKFEVKGCDEPKKDEEDKGCGDKKEEDPKEDATPDPVVEVNDPVVEVVVSAEVTPDPIVEPKEEIPMPENAGSTPEEAFTPSEVVPADQVSPEVIPDVQEVIIEVKPEEAIVEPVYESYFRVISEPVKVLAEKKMKALKGKLF